MKHTDHKKQTFETQIGQKATVHREDIAREEYVQANRELEAIGKKLDPTTNKVLTYHGSMAVHIYESKTLGQLFLMTQLESLKDCPEVLAAKACTELRNQLMETYGRKAKRKRSGF